MFRMVLFGITGFIVLGLIGLSGVVALKKADNANKDRQKILSTIAIYKSAPLSTKQFIRTAMNQCLEKEVEGDLPTYYTDFTADALTAAIAFASKNQIKSLKDPKIRKFVGSFKKSLFRDAIKIETRAAREPGQVKARMMQSTNWITGNQRALRLCVIAKVEKFAATSL